MRQRLNKEKINFYRLENGLDHAHDCPYKIILSTRSDGKSYAVKERALGSAFKDPERNKFIYLRRYWVDIESKLGDPKKYFQDMPIEEITKGVYNTVQIRSNEVFFANSDPTTGKCKFGVKIGYVMALSADEHYKSGDFTDVSTVIYEEFITTKKYLTDEPNRLMQLVSTICRLDNIQVYMIGNTLSRLCPYFREWQLTNVPKQKAGTIDIYPQETDRFDDDGQPIVVNVAVHYAEPAGNVNKMSFGTAGKSISGGIWTADAKPKIPKSRKEYSCMYKVYFHVMDFMFLAEFLHDDATGGAFWFVSPKTRGEIDIDSRCITDQFSTNPLWTQKLVGLSTEESRAFSYIDIGKICYSDNLTGTEFEQALRQLRGRLI